MGNSQFYKQYDSKTLKKLQNAEKDILIDLITVFEKHDIDYFISYGTLIGALRHQGFIPWDDDLDIVMMRNDYEKFQSVFDKELADRYVFATPLSLHGYSSSVTKIMRKETEFIPRFSDRMKCFMGIHIDIFVYDYVDPSSKYFDGDVRKSRLDSMLLFLIGSADPDIDTTTVIGKIEKVLCKAIHYLLCWIPGLSRRVYTNLDRIGKRYNSTNKEFVTSFFDCIPYKTLCNESMLLPTKKVLFEDIEVSVPADADGYLKQIYGDYMEIPPVEKRVNHRADKIVFLDE